MAKKTRPPLTIKKLTWAGQFKSDATLRGETLHYNAAVQSRFVGGIQALIAKMAEETEKKIRDFFSASVEGQTQDASPISQARILTNSLAAKFDAFFASRGQTLSEQMLSGSESAAKAQLHSSLKALSGGLSLKTGVVPTELKEAFKAEVVVNANLIRSISKNYLTGVQNAVMWSLSPGGRGLEYLVPYMQRHTEITQRHARNVALDQTRKAFNAANSLKMQELGIEEFEWIHSGGGAHPREDHIDMDRKTFRFDDPPVIGVMYGVKVRGLPGGVPGCKCTMRPVIRLESGNPV